MSGSRNTLAIRSEPPGSAREIDSSRTFPSNGDVAVRLTVFCSLARRAVALQECLSCSECDGLEASAEEGGTVLVCRAADAAERSRRALMKRWGAADLNGTANITPISRVMTREVTCVSPEHDLPSTADLMLERGISGIPVVDAARRPLGIVTKTDLLRALRTSPAGERAVRDIMAKAPFALPQGESVARAAALMAFEGVHRLLVVSPNGEVVGIVSSIDVLRWLAREHGFVIAG